MKIQVLASVVISVACLSSSLPAAAADPGVTDTEIKLGQTGPFSGPYSAASALMNTHLAYFKMINEKGGINGRKINLISLDDAYSPPKTAELTRQLVEKDNVFLIFGQVGSPAMAVQQYLNAKGVPQVLVSAGASAFIDPVKFPWTLGTTVSYHGEAVTFGQYIKQKLPNAKVGIFYQNDSYGRDYVNGVTEGLGELAKTAIVAKASIEPSEPTYDSQMLSLKASGANVLVIGAGLKPTVLAIRKTGDLVWKPQIFVSSGASSVTNVMEPAGVANGIGAIGTTVYKDPGDPRWAKDPEYIEYAAFMAKYLPQVDKNDNYAVYNYMSAQTMVKVLTDAGNNLTRENIKKLMTSMKGFRPKMAAPGVSFTMTPTDYNMIKKLQLVRFNGKGWELFAPGPN